MDHLSPLLEACGSLVLRALVAYSSLILLCPLVSVYQEHKLWKHPSVQSLTPVGMLKVYIFNVIWMGLTLVGSLILLPKWALGGFGRSVEYEAHCLVERMSAIGCIGAMVGPVEIRGKGNLPPRFQRTGQPAPVYVANHASQIDVGAVYYLRRRFKWISKKSVTYLPGVGQIMALSGHVFIQRKGKNRGTGGSTSVSNLYAKSNEAIQGGIPMFLFPQGTRRLVERIPFKDGAFNIALSNQSLIVPISFEIPPSAWEGWYPLSLLWGWRKKPIVLTVHEPIQVKAGMNKDDLKKRCYDTIYSVLPDHGSRKES